ncbi:3'-5' exonuclease [Photobacterium gaetbulicola]|uniref:Putative exonuclease RNase T and DNA polymerase III n=1 Tax=Photobacterium gaetbulicola Gung47 TaxID=658445 RepID=A0A0C5WHQ0_9GAMM|nr:3'-5' exonuclease [Photobacterium gaetbulicola]AJR06668.1 putative exonuclease RNase T and DNA polymerase III [Photobacterium gaetbulicola Gung47]PSU13988.1 3'-5' exonuclease [Photobacterium gaetbulicola]
MKRVLSYFKPLNRLSRGQAKWRDTYATRASAERVVNLLGPGLPAPDSTLLDLDILCLDFETTGLNPGKDQILSIGYVEMQKGMLNLSSSEETFIKDSCGINAHTAIINQITPEMLTSGQALDEAMEALFERMAGKVVLVHGLSVEKSFLEHYVQQRVGIPLPPLLWLDTLLIEKMLVTNRHMREEGDYRLSSIRQRYGLPEYPSHGALIDAVATGELLLALMTKCFGHSSPRLEEVYDLHHYELTMSQ